MNVDQPSQEQWLNSNVLRRNSISAGTETPLNTARSSLTIGTSTTPSSSSIGQTHSDDGISGNMVIGHGQPQQNSLGAHGPPSLQFTQGYLPNPLPPISNKAGEPQGGGGQAQQHQQQSQVHLQHLQEVHGLHHQQQQHRQHQVLLQGQEPRWKKHSVVTSEIASKRTTQDNILKLVALRNKDRPLSEYASTVRVAEVEVLNMDAATHSKSDIQAAEQHRERERQVYAMIWLMNNCVPDTESYVPRGRIFAQYAASCASNNLRPLSQATLGKLIRSLFPHLKTRRLGMRGQSKYHYCGLKLIPSLLVADGMTSTATPSSSCVGTPVKNINAGTSFNNSVALNTSGVGVRALTPTETLRRTGSAGIGSRNEDTIKFINNFFERTCEEKVELPLALPPISPFLPQSVDLDIASSVESLYKVFCNQLFENIRFMKFDDLPATLESFSSGSISPQMYNLFISEELYPWVEQSDLVTHRALAKMLSSLIVEFDDIPEIVLDKLSQFSTNYLELVTKTTIDLPLPVVTSKKTVVSQFIQLVKRLVKVIDTGKNASKILSLELTRNNMSHDWDNLINFDELLVAELSHFQEYYPKMREGMITFIQKEVLGMLTQESTSMQEQVSNGGNLLTQIAKRLCALLQGWKHLPGRLVALSFVSLTTAALRELSLNDAESFGAWWVFKSFLDEWVYWCGEVGCFLEQ